MVARKPSIAACAERQAVLISSRITTTTVPIRGRSGRAPAALAHRRAVLAICSDHVEAPVNLGNDLQRLGQPEAALECFWRALELRPDFLGCAPISVRRFRRRVGTTKPSLATKPASRRQNPSMCKAATLRGPSPMSRRSAAPFQPAAVALLAGAEPRRRARCSSKGRLGR